MHDWIWTSESTPFINLKTKDFPLPKKKDKITLFSTQVPTFLQVKLCWILNSSWQNRRFLCSFFNVLHKSPTFAPKIPWNPSNFPLKTWSTPPWCCSRCRWPDRRVWSVRRPPRVRSYTCAVAPLEGYWSWSGQGSGGGINQHKPTLRDIFVLYIYTYRLSPS